MILVTSRLSCTAESKVEAIVDDSSSSVPYACEDFLSLWRWCTSLQNVMKSEEAELKVLRRDRARKGARKLKIPLLS
jgi:hypothetical protein